MYSDLYLRPHYRPSNILIAMAIIVAVSSGIFYYSSGSVPVRASKTKVSRQEIVNVTPHQAGVYWETDNADEGWLLYGEDPNNMKSLALDVFIEKGEAPKRTYHYAVLTNLKSDTTYYYAIVSENEMILSAEKKPFTVRTASSVGSSGSLTPAYGKIAKTNGEAAKNIVVMLTIPEAYPLLAITGNTGEWLVPLQYFVSRNKGMYIVPTESTIVQILAFSNSEVSKINTSLEKTHPLPQTIVLGENYTFAEPAQVLSVQTDIQSSESRNNRQHTVAIRYPRNNSVIPGTAPLIKGFGVPGMQVTVNISSNPAFSTTVIVDKDGQWEVPVSRAFFPGKYTISAVTQNQNNRLVEIKHTYTLIKSGERVLGESTGTPSATLIPSPTRPVILTPTQGVTPAVTTYISPTTAIITTTPSLPLESPTPPPPVSGVSNAMPYVMTGVGFVIVGAGLLLLL